MTIEDFKQSASGFSQMGHSEKIRLLGWYLHYYDKKETFLPADIKRCYDALHEVSPSSFSGYFTNLVTQKHLLKNKSGYRLSGDTRDKISAAYAPQGHKLHVTSILSNLPAQIPDLAERTFLNETLICYEHSAFRAAVVMAWNIAYHRLCDYVIKHRLSDFNTRWKIKYPGHHKNGAKTISKIDDFMQELKESEVIQICRDAGIITKDVYKIMDEKLGRRNSAAHPSSVSIGQLQTDALIVDLIENVVLKLK
jgi:hypothetical protein